MKKVFLALMAVVAIALTGCDEGNLNLQTYSHNLYNYTDRVVAIATGYPQGKDFAVIDNSMLYPVDSTFSVQMRHRSSDSYMTVIVADTTLTRYSLISLDIISQHRDSLLTKTYKMDPVPVGKTIVVVVNQNGQHQIGYLP